MEKVNATDALNKLLITGHEFLYDADSLKYLIEDGMIVNCFENSDSVMFICSDHGTDYVTILPMQSSFDISDNLDVIDANCKVPSLLINIQKLSPECVEKADQCLSKHYKCEKTFVDYMLDTVNFSSPTADLDTIQIRFLDSADKEMINAFGAEPSTNRPPLSVLFDIFVIKKQGYILGAFDKDKMIGYLSFNVMLQNVFDLDYIYVAPEYRMHGIGTLLGKNYAEYAQENNYSAYWSNAKNIASKKTAESCGFHIIRQATKYIQK